MPLSDNQYLYGYFLILIFWMNTSMMISVTRGNRRGSSINGVDFKHVEGFIKQFCVARFSFSRAHIMTASLIEVL
jgi:hypothetical protein